MPSGPSAAAQGDAAFHCNACGGATTATRRLRFHRLPRVLIMHLKRFGTGSKWNEKVATHITFPTRVLPVTALNHQPAQRTLEGGSWGGAWCR